MIRRLAGVAAALLLAGAAVAADQVEVLGTSAGLPPPPPPGSACMAPDCATVVAINAVGRKAVPVQSIDGSGVYLADLPGVGESDLAASGLMENSPYFSAQDQQLAPLEGTGGIVKYENLWRVVVRYDAGVLKGVVQNYPPLFNVGDRVRVDGNRIRLAQ